MNVGDVMTRDVTVVGPDDTIRKAAQLMDELNVGVLPVCDGERLVGMITDRDIVVRALAAGRGPDATVVDAMSDDVRWCFEDDSIPDVMAKMADMQIRRIPVVDREKRLVGIVSLGDLATEEQPYVAGTLEDISTPSRPDR